MGSAQRAHATVRPVTDGQVRYHVCERAAECGYRGKAACTAAVGARNGAAGSEASQRTSSPNQRVLANRAPKPGTDFTTAAAISITAAVICRGGTNGYNTVTWAGISRLAEQSSLARSRPTTGVGLGNRDQDRAFPQTRKICGWHEPSIPPHTASPHCLAAGRVRPGPARSPGGVCWRAYDFRPVGLGQPRKVA